jgi:hypothetical protein
MALFEASKKRPYPQIQKSKLVSKYFENFNKKLFEYPEEKQHFKELKLKVGIRNSN